MDKMGYYHSCYALTIFILFFAVQCIHSSNINGCANNLSCHANATCNSTDGSFKCTCNKYVGDERYFIGNGTYCEEVCPPNYCNFCNEDCISDGMAGWKCICKMGFHKPLHSRTCIDIDECKRGGVCHEHARCNNTVGSYACTCKDDYQGNGTYCEEIPCDNGTSPCHVDAKCTLKDDSFHCTCNKGLQGNGFNCTDIEECKGNNSCHQYANCTEKYGSYDCHCKSGFAGNGTHCKEVCPPNHCPSSTESCIRSGSSWICVCADGFIKPTGFRSCIDNPECFFGTHSCNANATCSETWGSHKCQCNTGYSGNGFQCNDVNECEAVPYPCHVNATCNNTDGAYTCQCNEEYVGDGFNCKEDMCPATLICSTTSECMKKEGEWQCVCKTGFEKHESARDCNDINECLIIPDVCHTNATCINYFGSHSCACNTGFTGNGTYCF